MAEYESARRFAKSGFRSHVTRSGSNVLICDRCKNVISGDAQWSIQWSLEKGNQVEDTMVFPLSGGSFN